MTSDQPIARKSRKTEELTADTVNDLEQSTAEFLMTRYGPLLDAKALIEVLHYSGQLALERSIQRGHLKVRTFHLSGRRGVFAHAKDVARYIAKQMADTSTDEESDSQSNSRQSGWIEKGA